MPQTYDVTEKAKKFSAAATIVEELRRQRPDYQDHLQKVQDILRRFGFNSSVIATALINAIVLDNEGVILGIIEKEFDKATALGVYHLNRIATAKTKAELLDEIKRAPPWVQSIKCAEIISNTGFINETYRNFPTELMRQELVFKEMLDVLDKAYPLIRSRARLLIKLNDPKKETIMPKQKPPAIDFNSVLSISTRHKTLSGEESDVIIRVLFKDTDITKWSTRGRDAFASEVRAIAVGFLHANGLPDGFNPDADAILLYTLPSRVSDSASYITARFITMGEWSDKQQDTTSQGVVTQNGIPVSTFSIDPKYPHHALIEVDGIKKKVMFRYTDEDSIEFVENNKTYQTHYKSIVEMLPLPTEEI